MKLDGRYYLDVTDLVNEFNEMAKRLMKTDNPDMDQSLYPKDTTEEKETVEETYTEKKGPLGPQWGVPGELQKPRYSNVPRYPQKKMPDWAPTPGYKWTNHIWGWYAERI